MGSHFITLYACRVENLSQVVRSKDSARGDVALQHASAKTDDETKTALRSIVSGEYGGNEANGEQFVRAFELICKSLDPRAPTVEIYDDEEATPQLWRFIWEGKNLFELPASPYGAPAFSWHDGDAVKSHLALFENDFQDVRRNKSYLSDGALEKILETLRKAIAEKNGIVVFVEY